uniref:Putative ATP-dependent DNA helicase CHR12 isoform X2 n=1 Tax=Rhizophora mucronata TaxID=61149 RepID=A0A2P2KCT0_RHIMU
MEETVWKRSGGRGRLRDTKLRAEIRDFAFPTWSGGAGGSGRGCSS